MTALGPYRILDKLGAGGMGEVYRARDTKLNRDVAIKVLPEAFAADPEGRARLTREAQALAALNHPNIAAIYGFEDSGATHALVMELVEGDDLSVLIARGPIALADALPVARQIADALQAAHDLGIIHRDLKPANVKVRADGTVKVLDFGLAKALDENGSSAAANAANSPTLTARATQMGMILGTAAYMAPEQARGRPVDRRADTWAFGVVLYEMLTGRRAFEGDDVSITLASVLKDDVKWDALPAETPASIRRLLRRCLEKDPKKRLSAIGDARLEIDDATAPDTVGPVSVVAASARGNRRELVAWIVAAGATLAALAFAMFRPAPATSDSPRIVRLPFVAPPAADLTELNYVVISPNGQQLLFSARSGTGPRQLWVRPLDSTDATPLPDTEDAIEPFWSPNSKSVAFGAQGKLKRLDLGSSKARILTDAARSNNGAWSSEGVIVFSPDYRSPLFKVSAEGGERTPLPDGRGGEHRYPAFLPDGRHFLSPAGGRLVAGSLDGRDWKEVLTGVSAAVYAPPGVLLYLRAGVVVAQPFDVNRLEVSGEPQSLGTTVTGDWASGTRLSVSTNGVLVIQNTPMFDYQLTWFDAAGKLLGPFSPARHDIWNSEVPRISPDGTRVVVERLAEKDATRSLWLSDPGRSTFDRLTLGSVFHQLPIWSSDGRSIISSGARTAGGGGGISVVPIGVGEERELVSGTLFPQDATPDGKWLIYAQRGETTRLDLWRLPLAHGKAAGEASVIANSPFEETQARVSANSQWIAYVSDTTGVNEVYVRSLDAGGEVGDAKRVTDGGGVQPVWSRDGRTLFYMNTTNGYRTAQLMKVAVTTNGTAITFGTPAPIFKASLFPLFHVGDEYDVAPDGRFLVGIATPDTRVPAAMVVLNWAETLKGLERR